MKRANGQSDKKFVVSNLNVEPTFCHLFSLFKVTGVILKFMQEAYRRMQTIALSDWSAARGQVCRNTHAHTYMDVRGM